MTVSGPIGATLAAYALAGERVFEGARANRWRV
jgi:hypothetical protein